MIAGYLQDLLKVLGFATALAALPLFAGLAALQPPWPPGIQYVSSGIVLLASLIVWEWNRRTVVRVRRAWILWAAGLTLAGLLSYLLLYSVFVEGVPGGQLRVVRGFVCTPDAQLVYGAACPDLDRDALKGAEWEAVRLWTRQSVTVARAALTVSWLVFISGLVAAFGAIIAGRKVQVVGRKPVRAQRRG